MTIRVSQAIETLANIPKSAVAQSPAAKALRELCKHFIMIGCQYDWDDLAMRPVHSTHAPSAVDSDRG